ncbi:hypothetical protein L6164_016501 [Bauhinia variegata]|uniref:Uncharacterized protein n=1 Tax=Bauhinia variegata TaxID=167791 RepID=A0ACB9NNV3_BAUVA|nr:hypothetical protein L6164_016501 [Bauhinia variegata]
MKGIVLLLSLLALLTTNSDARIKLLKHRIFVVIANDLSGGLDLTLHCKSRDDDLGEHLLHTNQTFEFNFRPYFWGTTLFYCSFQWKGGALIWFDIYKEMRELKSCTLCKWIIRENGPCRYDYITGSYSDCYPWNNSTILHEKKNALQN